MTKCPFPCGIKSDYGNCRAGRCMNSQYKSMWNGDELDLEKMKQYKDYIKQQKEKA